MNSTEKLPISRRKQSIRDEEEEGLITVDADRCVVVINTVARDMLGMAESSMIGTKVIDLMSVVKLSVRNRVNKALRQVLSSGSSGNTIRHVRLVTKSGAVCLASLTFAPIASDTGDVIGVLLTLRREEPEKDRVADVSGREDPEVLNLLAGRIAHDINNSLSAILANIQLAQVVTDEQSDVYQRLNNAVKGVLHARDLSGQLLELSVVPMAQVPVAHVAAQKQHPAVWPSKGKRLARIAAATEKAAPDKILLMDDEDAILSATSEMLKFLGYDVIVAENGDVVVDLYSKAQEAELPFGAVILDVTVPGGKGALETLPALKNIDPNVRAIVSSGYATNPVIVDFASYGFTSVIVKPYGFKELDEALATAFRS